MKILAVVSKVLADNPADCTYLTMAGTRMKKDVDSSSKKKVVAAPGTNWALSIAVICVTMVTFSIFGYILAHSHLTLGKYDERLKFITNKIETFAKNNAGKCAHFPLTAQHEQLII